MRAFSSNDFEGWGLDIDMDKKWQSVKRELQESLPKGQYDLWVSTIDCLGIQDGSLLLGCRNRFHADWLREKLEAKLLPIVVRHFPQVHKLEYQIMLEHPNDPDEPSEGSKQVNFGELIRRSGPSFNPRFTFDQFVVGNCNHFAFAASMAMATGQQFYNQSVYLLSNSGLGKSHLSHAVGNFLHKQQPQVSVQYVTTEQFANEMVLALKTGSIEAFKNRFRCSCDVLLIERVEFLSGKEKLQSELVYTLDELMDRGKKVLCTGSFYPKDIPKLTNELQSRLSGFLMASIERPDFTTRLEIIKRKTRFENVSIPVEIMEFLADRVTDDVRQIESCIVGIIAKANILGVPISLRLAQEVIRTMLDYLPKINVNHIQEAVCEAFQISLEELNSRSRRKEIAAARKIAMYLCRQYTTQSLLSIGQSFKRSHSSVLHAINEMTKEMKDQGSKLKRQVEYVIRRLETSCLSKPH
jgi:chromosomal replication initiator protein